MLDVFRDLGIDALVTIGGDDTAYSAQPGLQAGRAGAIRVAHVPKTIDNDLPLPGSTPTFGFETARHVGVGIVRNLAEDARTTVALVPRSSAWAGPPGTWRWASARRRPPR